MTYQQITIVGNVGNDPKFAYTDTGVARLTFSLAGSYSTRSQDGQWANATCWWRVTVWGQLAESIQNYVNKGKSLLVTGSRIETHAFTGKDGQPKAALQITADTVRLLGKRDHVDSEHKTEDLPF